MVRPKNEQVFSPQTKSEWMNAMFDHTCQRVVNILASTLEKHPRSLGYLGFLWLNGYYYRATMPKQWEHRLALNAGLHPSIAYWSNHSTAEPTNRSSISQLLLCCRLTLIWKHTSAVLHPRSTTGMKSGPGVDDFFFKIFYFPPKNLSKVTAKV